MGWYFFIRQTIHQLVLLSRTKVIASGLDKVPQKPMLIISNHLSMFDVMVIMEKLKCHPMISITKPENENIPICGTFIHRAGFISIDRQNNQNALKSIQKACRYIENNRVNIYICPEGTRSKTGELLPFHPGSFKIATRTKVDIVVCCIRNTNQFAKNFPFKKTYVHVDVLDVIHPEDYEQKNTVELAEQARQMIQNKLEESREK